MPYLKYGCFSVLFLGAVPLCASAQEHQGHPQPTSQPSMPEGEHHMRMMQAPLGIPMNREASGTSWLPDSSPIYALGAMTGDWMWMLHGNLFGIGTVQSGERGDTALHSINWVMGMVRGPVLGGTLTGRTMLSLEPFTVGEEGYPLLLQSGEGLVDRQHPHDLFMELAAQYRHAVSKRLAVSLYGALAGEPALGPTAYPHRISSFPNPSAPLSHHWIDSTHITFGVLTAGVYSKRVMLEGSLFNGREPSQEGRTDLELQPFDSFSGRLTIAPTRNLVAQVSAGRLSDPEEGEEGDVTRFTASIEHNIPLPRGGNLAHNLAAGLNVEEDHSSLAVLTDASLDTRGPSVFFGRAEVVGKPGDELALPTDEIFPVGALSLGYLYELPIPGNIDLGIGLTGTINVLSEGLAPFYGGQLLPSGLLFVRLWPGEMQMAQAPRQASL